MTSRPQTTATRLNCVEGDSNQNTQMADKQVLADPGQGIVRRTRTALGDIGNRLTQKEGSAAPSNFMDNKRGPLGGKLTSGFGRKVTNAITSGALQANSFNKATVKLTRTNSVQVVTNGTGRNILERGKLARSNSTVVREKATNIEPPVLVKVEEGYVESKVEIPTVRCNVTVPISVPPTGENKVPDTAKVIVRAGVGDVQIDDLAQAFSSQRFGESEIHDIDAADTGEFMLKEYVKDIDNYMHTLEKAYPIREDFLKDRSVNSKMRAVLLDWMVDVHNQFGLCQETLYLSGKILDRYLQLDKTISRTQLQLAGVTALFIAVKFEEVYVPTIVDFSAVSDNAFTPGDVRKMEGKMLKALNFDLASPLPITFLRRCSKALEINMDSYVLSKLIVELSMLDYNLCHIYPSVLAAASLALAYMVLNSEPIQSVWTESVVHYSRYTLEQLKPVIRALIATLSRPYEEKDQCRFNASMNKFARSKLMRISKLPELKSLTWKPRVLAEIAKIQ